MRTDAIYGNLPVDLGRIELSPTELMFWLYCPVKLPGQDFPVLPDSLKQYGQIVFAAMANTPDIFNKYVYLTAKTLFTTPENPGNRPGWHSDGFLTDDLNFIWYDANPTIFFEEPSAMRWSFSKDHVRSLPEMDNICEPIKDCHVTYSCKHLLKLDETVLHKVDTNITPGVRTFVKVSCSYHKYALQGNSINHALAPDWECQKRGEERNCPIGKHS